MEYFHNSLDLFYLLSTIKNIVRVPRGRFPFVGEIKKQKDPSSAGIHSHRFNGSFIGDILEENLSLAVICGSLMDCNVLKTQPEWTSRESSVYSSYKMSGQEGFNYLKSISLPTLVLKTLTKIEIIFCSLMFFI